jgi:uncharacterized protein
MNSIIENNKLLIDKLCLDNEVDKLYIFGSVLNDDFNESSDIDFIVDIKNKDAVKYTDYYFNLLFGFEKLFKRNIDLLTTNSLKNPYFIKEIEKKRKLIYG